MIDILLYGGGVLIFVAAIMGSIALHELGHLYFAKRFGARVSQYMVGFGKTLFSIRRGDTEYGIKAIPLGGFVKIVGMFPPSNKVEHARSRGEFVEGDSPQAEAKEIRLRKSNTGIFAQMVSETRASEFETIEPGDEDRLFYKQPWYKKVVVMVAGPAMNIAIAFVCLLGVYSLHGVHSNEPTGEPVVAAVGQCVIPETEGRSTCTAEDPPSPAKQAGLLSGDEITALNGQTVGTWEEIQQVVRTNGEGELIITVVRDGQELTLTPTRTATMQRDLSGDGELTTVGFLGVEPVGHTVITRGGPIYTLERMGEMTMSAVKGISQLPVKVWNVAGAIAGVQERDPEGPMSVVGGSRLAGEIASTTTAGIDTSNKVAMLGLLVGGFNLFIGIFNLLPVLPLDGGHIVGSLWEGLRRRLAALLKRPDPGYVDVARQLPLAYALGITMLSLGLVLMIGDLVVPIPSGL